MKAQTYLDDFGHLRPATTLLLHSVSKVPLPLLQACRVYPTRRNWLHFPWYSQRSGGGAVAIVDRIYASGRYFGDSPQDGTFLLLLAHEVGHLLHAKDYPMTAWGRTRFVLWTSGHYLRSLLRNGTDWHRNARIEQEAERGRWVLRRLFLHSGPRGSDQLLEHIRTDDANAVQQWLLPYMDLIDRLHRDYPGWS